MRMPIVSLLPLFSLALASKYLMRSAAAGVSVMGATFTRCIRRVAVGDVDFVTLAVDAVAVGVVAAVFVVGDDTDD